MPLTDLINRPEGKNLEFKRDLSSLRPILRTLVAFANTAGGTLVIGREDDGSLCGVDDVLRAEEQLANAIADAVRPQMTPEIESCTVDGKNLLIVKVPHWLGPFYLAKEGPERGAYIRLGSTNRQAGPEFLAEIQRAKEGQSFDRLPCIGTTIDDLNLPNIEKAFSRVGRQIDQAKLESLGVLAPYAGSLAVSNGGLILFGKEGPRLRHFPDARVSCARFLRTSKAEFLDRLDIEGTILDAVTEVPKFIRRNTRMAAEITGMQRRDIPEYSEIALREVFVNALVHADYSLTGMRTLVSIYDDRMDVQNPGMLPFGMTLEDFKSGVSRVRNRVIARVFRELNLIEEWGSGYLRITEACHAGGYPLPDWQEFGPALRTVLRPHPKISQAQVEAHVPTNVPINVPINDRQAWFLEQLRAGSKTRAADLAGHWKITEKTAKRDLAALKDKDLIEFVGPLKTGYYRLKKDDRTED